MSNKLYNSNKIDILIHKDSNLDLIVSDLKKVLTEEQFKIAKLKIQGYMNIEIAKRLRVCPATIGKKLKKIGKLVERYVKNGHSGVRKRPKKKTRSNKRSIN